MEEIQKPDSHIASAAAFVEGGIQDACDDACSICLEEFSENDPSTVTNCKHEFHLQCILEWCQRSSQCPMCWQAISLKDPTSQELLQAVERERSFRVTPSRNTTIFHHPTLGGFELQHLPVGVNDPELEERIIQHLAAAGAMGRAHHAGRREGQRRSSAHSHPHFLVFSTHLGAQHPGSGSSPLTHIAGETEAATITVAGPSSPLSSRGDELSQQISPFPSAQNTLASGPTASPVNRGGFSFNNRSTSSNSSLPNQERAGPSEFQSFPESLKSRLNAVSERYKESISKSSRGWKERWFSRNSSMSHLGNEVRREVNAGIASVSRMMERLETSKNNRENQASVSHHLAESSVTEQDNQHNAGAHGDNPLSTSPSPASHAASSLSK
ncbi:E3 ubiquitin-protein ligase RHF2A-like isoform X2 [Durio zibethinus]|uniref:RING-type E3 ubiquitin transferase n=1 Tax=Durio zibethinus TaxID=66656 RepID=A0A6P6AQ44_DURZI|nr:E3 ubiquitin-protein ligase RHF2A-like isoform X2 [Durio zibethinus]XP_022766917.1 E3 ubiquitin-protein ligase RHF2A-like isoform X2 [Durio zibethinus]